jgi:hypothetical protein
MFSNRLQHLTAPHPAVRVAGGCSDAFAPVPVAAAQFAWVQEVYRLAAEQTRSQLAPPRFRWDAGFSRN